MTQNKKNNLEKSSENINSKLTSMAMNSNESRKSKNGFKETGGNRKENQLK